MQDSNDYFKYIDAIRYRKNIMSSYFEDPEFREHYKNLNDYLLKSYLKAFVKYQDEALYSVDNDEYFAINYFAHIKDEESKMSVFTSELFIVNYKTEDIIIIDKSVKGDYKVRKFVIQDGYHKCHEIHIEKTEETKELCELIDATNQKNNIEENINILKKSISILEETK